MDSGAYPAFSEGRIWGQKTSMDGLSQAAQETGFPTKRSQLCKDVKHLLHKMHLIEGKSFKPLDFLTNVALPRGMSETGQTLEQRRNRNYEETHRQLVERAVALIGRDGIEALTVASLARDSQMNRSTVYYHFDSREALLAAAKAWFGARLGEMMVAPGDSQAWLEKAVQFTLGNPELMREWVTDLVNQAPISRNFPRWGELVELASRSPLARQEEGKGGPGSGLELDAELWATILLASVVTAARLFRVAVRPGENEDLVARHYARLLRRMLQSSSRLTR